MSTLVSFVLAAVLNILGGEMPKELDVISEVKIEICDDYETVASNSIIIKNEQLFKVKGIR
jgi:L-cysteine desulfidase